jgi:hypothetical protein
MVSTRKRILKKRKTMFHKNRRFRGGVNTTSDSIESQGPMNISELDTSQATMNISELNVTDDSDINNTTLDTNDLSIANEPIRQNIIPTITPVESHELDISMDSDLSSLSGNTSSEDISMTFGGKKKLGGKSIYKRKHTSKNKKSYKKGRKTRKTRKNKRQKGGRGFTTSVTTNPIAYKEDEYDQFKNALNYKV